MTITTAPTAATGFQTREFKVRAVDTDAREVTGIAVPWEEPVQIGSYYSETVARGAVQDSDDAKLFWDHAEPIGILTRAADTDAGWEITAHISETARGDEAYTLLRDGVIDRLSIGFQPITDEVTENDDGSISVRRIALTVREVSLVPFAAYDAARVSAVRSTPHPTTPDPAEEAPIMEPTTITPEDVDELRGSIDDLTRRVDVGLTPTPAEPADLTRSFGEFVQLLAAGDENITRAYNGAVSGDGILRDQWIGSLVDIIHKRQVVAGTFQRGTLPAKGLTVEYAVLDDDSTTVEEQSAEGEDLEFGKLSIDLETAPVVTLGGWSSMSRQAIERTENVSILDTTFRALAEKYGRAVEVLARAALTTAIGSADTVTGDLTSQVGIITALLDLSEEYEDRGLSLDGLFVAKDVFLSLYGVAATERVLQVTGAPADKAGTITVNSLTADLAGLPVRVLPGAAGGTVAGYDATSLRTLESAGAPIRLQDDNIINLSRDFSVYGYAASFVQRPAGIVTITDA